MKQTLPLAITFLVGSLLVAEFFIPYSGVHGVVALLQEWGLVVAGSAFVLGAINVIQVNVPKIRRREADWGYRLVLVVSAVGMAAIGFWEGGDQGVKFNWIYVHIFSPANASMFALLAFFIASAAFRAFRARNLEASLMLGAAMVVMLGVIPLGELISPHMPEIKDWILNYANNAGRRAIMVGAAIGAAATGLRIILGLERSHLGGD